MHGPPIAIVIAKKEAGAPDFSGPSMLQARKELIPSPDLPDLPDEPHDEAGPDHSSGVHGKLMDIAARIREGADLNLDLAGQIEDICAEMQAGHSDSPDPDQSDEPDDTGEAKVFEPAE